jgi:hypothetical protein
MLCMQISICFLFMCIDMRSKSDQWYYWLVILLRKAGDYTIKFMFFLSWDFSKKFCQSFLNHNCANHQQWQRIWHTFYTIIVGVNCYWVTEKVCHLKKNWEIMPCRTLKSTINPVVLSNYIHLHCRTKYIGIQVGAPVLALLVWS